MNRTGEKIRRHCTCQVYGCVVCQVNISQKILFIGSDLAASQLLTVRGRTSSAIVKSQPCTADAVAIAGRTEPDLRRARMSIEPHNQSPGVDVIDYGANKRRCRKVMRPMQRSVAELKPLGVVAASQAATAAACRNC
jgi:hypothetical protein